MSLALFAIAATPAPESQPIVTPAPTSVPKVPKTYRAEKSVPRGGSLVGRILYKGALKAAPSQPISRNRDLCGKRLKDPFFELRDDGGVGGVVIEVLGLKRGKASGRAKIRVDHAQCRFDPPISIAMVGNALILRNSDPVLHQLRALRHGGSADGEELFHYAMPIQGMELPHPLTEPGRIELLCSAGHEASRAFVYVADHPYVTVSDREGRFGFDDLSPATHKLRAWHPRFGTLEHTIVTKPVEETTLELVFE